MVLHYIYIRIILPVYYYSTSDPILNDMCDMYMQRIYIYILLITTDVSFDFDQVFHIYTHIVAFTY